MKALDLFAGAGGWDVAGARLGWDIDGVEIMPEANATRAAAGHRTIHHDVTTFHAAPGAYHVGIASPSCKRYSMAGNGNGRRALEHVLAGVRLYGSGAVHEFDEMKRAIGDEDAALTLEPLRIFLACEPEFIALEQVPSVLPVWQAYADVLREHGYSVACATVGAEQYGVPQTRRRAVLLARRDEQEMLLPVPTHSRFHVTDPKRLDDGVKPWVSMAEALGWDDPAEVVSNYGTGGDPANRGRRSGNEPFAAITSKADRFKVTHMAAAGITGEGRPRAIAYPGPTITSKGTAAWMSGAQRWRAGNAADDRTTTRNVTPEEASKLQTFPDGYPFQGGKSRVMEQIGNAIPPMLAEVMLRQFNSPVRLT